MKLNINDTDDSLESLAAIIIKDCDVDIPNPAEVIYRVQYFKMKCLRHIC